MKRSLIALTALVCLSSAPALAAPAVTQIEVTGTGSVTMVPNQATINASITTVDPNAQTATSRNNATYEAVTNALVGQGVARNDIALSFYNVSYQPKPQPAAGPAVPVQPNVYGYTVTRAFTITVRDMSKTGALVDRIATQDGIEINNVGFGLADSRTAREQATDKAVADARTKAELLAKAAGLRITSIQRVALEGGGIPVPIVRLNAEAARAQVPTTFDPGNVNVTINVGVIFTASP